MPMSWQALQIPLVGGLSQKNDARSLQPPALAVARDIQFDETGGIQTRAPYQTLAATSNAIFGGGTLSNIRRFVANGDELLCFTRTNLYSWNAAIALWVDKGEHPAIAIDETPQFETTSDQTQCDRAELAGTIVYCWRDEALGGGTAYIPGTNAGPAGTVYVAAIDKATGSVLLAPTAIAHEMRPRLVALATKILLLTTDSTSGDFSVRVLDPASPASGIAAPTLVKATGSLAGASLINFDVARVASADLAGFVLGHATNTSYTVGTIDSAGTILKTDKARTSDNVVAVAADPTGTYLQVVRGVSGALKGDLVAVSGFVDVHVTTAISSSLGSANQIAIAYSLPIVSGHYVAHVWWSQHEYEFVDAFTVGTTEHNTIDTANTVGTQATFMPALSIGSRAFSHTDGHVFVHLVFSQPNRVARGRFPQLQNTYFLYREDGRLCGQVAPDVAGGYLANGSYQSVVGYLPGVVSIATDVFSWCAQRRRRIPLGGGTLDQDYSARSPLDTAITFDDQRARRCQRLGETLYITGAEIMQYDGEQLAEVGFHLYPWRLGAEINGSSGLPDGTYTYKSTFRWDNAKGERERSTTAVYFDVTFTGGPFYMDVKLPCLNVTHKTNAKSPVILEAWRTLVNPASTDAPMYLVTSLDPTLADTANFNRFVANTLGSQAAAMKDQFIDDDLDDREENEEVGAVLENLAPPPATILAASQDRIFLAGVAGDPHTIWYSKTRDEGRIAAWNDGLTIAVPPAGGDLTALALLSETLVVFREHAIYVVPGEGFTNNAEGQNYGPPRVVSSDCGAVSAESVALTELGLMFKCAKGWYVLTPGWAVQYIGAPISGFDDETVYGVHVLDSKHQVRVVTSERILVWDYLVNQWAEWTGTANAVATCMWQGKHTWWSDDDAQAYTEQAPPEIYGALGGAAYGLDVETPWVKLNELAGRGRVRWIQITGEWRSACRVRVRVARDYEVDGGGDPAWFDDVELVPDTAIVGNRLYLEHGPRYGRFSAIKVRITAIATGDLTPPIGEALKLTGLGLEVGVQPGLNRNLSAAQKG